MNNAVANNRNAGEKVLLAGILVSILLAGCSTRDNDAMSDENTQDASSSGGGNPVLGPPSGGENTDLGSMPSLTGGLAPKSVNNPQAGAIYTNDKGMSLYIRYTDVPNKVTCTLTCQQYWEPLTTTVTTTGVNGDFDIILRDDGASQWMLLEYPLYLHRGDASAGSVLGDGFGDEWALARPVPTTSRTIDGDEALVASGATLAGANSTVRVNRDGHTLYFFGNDAAGRSSCNDACADSWPPLYADVGASARGRYSLITRDDGTTQWAYDGKALYFWQGDNAAGEFSGATVNNWNVARP